MTFSPEYSPVILMKTLMLALSLLLIPAFGQAAPVTKDVKKDKDPFRDNYEVLEGRTKSKTPMVTEMFSVYCGGCYMWEQKTLPELKGKLKEKKIPFEQGHVSFMGKYGEQATKAMAVALHTNHYDELKTLMFERIHKSRKDWSSDADFFATLKSAGISEKVYKDYQNSVFVLKSLQDWGELQKSIQAVPSFIVNNKYLIKSQGLKSNEQFIELIEYLIKQP